MITDAAGNWVQWVVYDRPSDFPDRYIARKWLVVRGVPDPVWTPDYKEAATLDEIRAQIPPGLYCLPRMPGDEPQIVEVWL